MKGIHIFLADGFEDVEALCTYDVLVRGGARVTLVSITGSLQVCSSHRVRVMADCLLSELDFSEAVSEKDFMVFPGGMPGSKTLAGCRPLVEAMQAHYDKGGSLAAICAAPGLVLGQLDGIAGKHFTCFDGFEQLPVSKGAVFEPRASVVSGRIITGRSAGYAQAFALDILAAVADSGTVEKVRSAMNLPTL